MSAYLRFPAILGDVVVFSAEDDLWMVSATGGRAFRLTAGLAEATYPRFSPKGDQLAFTGREEGPEEVYAMPADGGAAQRLTFHGARSTVTGWDPDGAILYASDECQPFDGRTWLHRVTPGGQPHRLPYGPATSIAHGPDGMIVLGRNTADPARWKRYRGGTAGDLWIDTAGTGEFHRLITLPGNLASPCWQGERICFLSDHDGVGNVYSCLPDGSDLRKLTDHHDFYARNLSGDGRTLVYHAGGDLYLLEPGRPARHVEVRLASSRTQRNRRFVEAADYLDSATLAPDGTGVALTTRGKAYTLACWEGPVLQHGQPDGVRYRLLTWLNDHRRLIAAASGERPDEHLVLIDDHHQRTIATLGRIVELAPDPAHDRVAVTTHRNELHLVDLDRAESTLVEANPHGCPEDLAWSPDGNWLAYAAPTTSQTSAIKLHRPATATAPATTVQATEPVLRDSAPAFDPRGRYLYFIGKRTFDPVYDALQFDLGFPLGSRPYALALRPGIPDPFVPVSRPLDAKDDDEDEPGDLDIDLDGLADRVTAFPLPEGRYERIAGVSATKILIQSSPLEGEESTLQLYDLDKNSGETFAEGVTSFELARDHKTVLYLAGDRIRVVKSGEIPEHDDDPPSRTSGWLDLDRVKVSLCPEAEWRQMFREAWRLQLEHFWSGDMAGLDWNALYTRYQPLVERVTTRGEFSDLLWELQGELGTSHAYESGGEYRPGPDYAQGKLGVDWDYHDGHYRIGAIVTGDRWDPDATSPLNRLGVVVQPGDTVLAINGAPIGEHATPNQRLVNQAGQEVELTLTRDGTTFTAVVKALADEQPARYRDWVNHNRARCHQASGGRVGYVHIPDMATTGFGEFHRGFLTEYDRPALVIDVRYNRGGHVSGLLLEKLARRRLGYDYPRWGDPEPYPPESPRGPMVALTNEWAGSDGDVFSHAFKLLRLGPLVGKRTWGGVFGIQPRHRLSDGTLTTQPEYSFAFDDVGWRVENYGTDPDVEVDITPQDYARGHDPQLDTAIRLALEQLESRPPHTPDRQFRPRMQP
ncbi:S41 family peptidase [Nonomuraea sp. NPDC050310]|uniref:S41 family peptidase n=1 Tax=Nonomuraea sp. NPDC050310 TaxID=3154935 RepID=UPI00340A3846